MVSGSMAQPTRIVLALARVATLLHASRAAAAPGAAIATTPARFRKSRRLDSAGIPFTLRFRAAGPRIRALGRGKTQAPPESQTAYRVWTAWYLSALLVKMESCADCPASRLATIEVIADVTGGCGPREGVTAAFRLWLLN